MNLFRRGGEYDLQLKILHDTGILATYLTYGIQRRLFHMAPNVSLVLVIIGLTTMAEQTAGWRYFHLAKPDQFQLLFGPASDGNVKILFRTRDH